MPEDIPWYLRNDLDPPEMEAVGCYIDKGIEMNAFLRKNIYFEASYRLSLLKTIQSLDRAIRKSTLLKSYSLFRGISGSFAETILDAVLDGQNIIREFGYSSFTYNKDVAVQYALECEDYGIIFLYDSTIGEQGLFIDHRECEIVFPRKISWYIIEKRIVKYGDCSVTFMYLDKETGY